MPCKVQDNSIYPNPEFAHIIDAYQKSVQLPKLMNASNFWVETEVMLNNIWKTEMREEEGISDSSQELEGDTDEVRKQRVEQQMRELATREVTRVQEQMELQLSK